MGGSRSRGPGPPITTGRHSAGSKQWLVRVSAAEAKAIERAAKAAGAISAAQWIRDTALRAAVEKEG